MQAPLAHLVHKARPEPTAAGALQVYVAHKRCWQGKLGLWVALVLCYAGPSVCPRASAPVCPKAVRSLSRLHARLPPSVPLRSRAPSDAPTANAFRRCGQERRGTEGWQGQRGRKAAQVIAGRSALRALQACRGIREGQVLVCVACVLIGLSGSICIPGLEGLITDITQS